MGISLTVDFRVLTSSKDVSMCARERYSLLRFLDGQVLYTKLNWGVSCRRKKELESNKAFSHLSLSLLKTKLQSKIAIKLEENSFKESPKHSPT